MRVNVYEVDFHLRYEETGVASATQVERVVANSPEEASKIVEDEFSKEGATFEVQIVKTVARHIFMPGPENEEAPKKRGRKPKPTAPEQTDKVQ